MQEQTHREVRDSVPHESHMRAAKITNICSHHSLENHRQQKQGEVNNHLSSLRKKNHPGNHLKGNSPQSARDRVDEGRGWRVGNHH